jgi:hypothetical protein
MLVRTRRVAGDFNTDTDGGVVKSRLLDRPGFVDVHKALGVALPTHPWTSSYNSNSMWGIIDHVVARGRSVTPAAAATYDLSVWLAFPVLSGQDANEPPRICATMQGNGADHFAVAGSVTFLP